MKNLRFCFFGRLVGVEDNLTTMKDQQHDLQHDAADTMLRLEGHQMYSRKQTLMITGEASALPTDDEVTRDYAIKLLGEHLGINWLSPSDISACHRLRNPKVILVRFVMVDRSERVYRMRTKRRKRARGPHL